MTYTPRKISEDQELTSPAADDYLPIVDVSEPLLVNRNKRVKPGPLVAQAPFMQAGTGAVARTVEGKLREVVSVKDFGAIGDGVTDDTAALLAAFGYVNDIQGELVFPGAGPYLCAQQLRWNRISVKGKSTEIKFAGLDANTDCLLLGGSDNNKKLSVESIFIDCNNTGRDGVVCTGGDNNINLLQKTQEFTESPWNPFLVQSSAANTTAAPDGTLTADTITFTANSFADVNQTVNTLKIGKTYTLSVWGQSVSGDSAFRLKYWDGSTGAYSSAQPVTATPQRFSFTFVATSESGATNVGFANTTDAVRTVVLWGAQLQEGQLSDYKRMGVTSGWSDHMKIDGLTVHNSVRDGFVFEPNAPGRWIEDFTISALQVFNSGRHGIRFLIPNYNDVFINQGLFLSAEVRGAGRLTPAYDIYVENSSNFQVGNYNKVSELTWISGEFDAKNPGAYHLPASVYFNDSRTLERDTIDGEGWVWIGCTFESTDFLYGQAGGGTNNPPVFACAPGTKLDSFYLIGGMVDGKVYGKIVEPSSVGVTGHTVNIRTAYHSADYFYDYNHRMYWGPGFYLRPYSSTEVLANGDICLEGSVTQIGENEFIQAMTLRASRNVLLGTTTPVASANRTIHIVNGTPPSESLPNGVVIYVENGALKSRGPSGTITTLGVA